MPIIILVLFGKAKEKQLSYALAPVLNIAVYTDEIRVFYSLHLPLRKTSFVTGIDRSLRVDFLRPTFFCCARSRHKLDAEVVGLRKMRCSLISQVIDIKSVFDSNRLMWNRVGLVFTHPPQLTFGGTN